MSFTIFSPNLLVDYRFNPFFISRYEFRCLLIAECDILQLFKCFSKLGICQSVDTTRRNIDALVTECDATMESWKRQLEVPPEAELDGAKNAQDSTGQGRHHV